MKKFFNLLMIGAMVALVSCDPKTNDPTTPTDGATFAIAVSDITASSATVAVTPSDTAIYYYYDVIDEASLLEYESKEAYADSLVDYMPVYVEWYNSYYGAYYGTISVEDFLIKGYDEYEFDDLDASTKYYVLAFQINATEWKRVGNVSFKEFTTPVLPKSDNIITFSHTDGDSIINITTTNDDDYLWVYIQKDTLDAYYESVEDCFEDYLNYYIDYYGSWFSLLLSSGDEEINTKEYFDTPDKYVFMAANIYNSSVINSDVFSFEIDVTQDMCGEAEDDDTTEDAAAPRKLMQNHQPKFNKHLRIK